MILDDVEVDDRASGLEMNADACSASYDFGARLAKRVISKLATKKN